MLTVLSFGIGCASLVVGGLGLALQLRQRNR